MQPRWWHSHGTFPRPLKCIQHRFTVCKRTEVSDLPFPRPQPPYPIPHTNTPLHGSVVFTTSISTSCAACTSSCSTSASKSHISCRAVASARRNTVDEGRKSGKWSTTDSGARHSMALRARWLGASLCCRVDNREAIRDLLFTATGGPNRALAGCRRREMQQQQQQP